MSYQYRHPSDSASLDIKLNGKIAPTQPRRKPPNQDKDKTIDREHVRDEYRQNRTHQGRI
jgi:hypothetical protein